MLGKIEDDGITYSMNLTLSKHQEIVKDREAWESYVLRGLGSLGKYHLVMRLSLVTKLSPKLSRGAKELMLLNCDIGEDS